MNGIEARPVRRRDPDGHTHGHADDAGRQNQRQAFGRLLPVALVEDEQEPGKHEQGGIFQLRCSHHASAAKIAVIRIGCQASG
jgi:hypothetical protein